MTGRVVVAFCLDLLEDDPPELVDQLLAELDPNADPDDAEEVAARNVRTIVATGGHAAAVELLLSRRVAGDVVHPGAAALRAAADDWQHGQWADAPRRADRVAERLANGQHVTDWLRARADKLEAGS